MALYGAGNSTEKSDSLENKMNYSRRSTFTAIIIAIFACLSFISPSMADDYPLDWDWAKEAKPQKLEDFKEAPKEIGIYEIGFLKKGVFEPQYVGRAIGITLRARLSKHNRNSHNKDIKKNVKKLYFRTKVFTSKKVASYVEAVTITAFEYPWNKKNEWKQHWALEN